MKIITTREYNRLKAIEAKANAKPVSDKKVNFEHVHTGKDGMKYFVTRRIEDLHMSRAVYLQSVLNQMALGIDNEQLQSMINECMQSARHNDFTKVIKLLSNISTRSQNITSPKLLYQGALYCVLCENEPHEYSHEWHEKKIALWKDDSEARFFFMHWFLTTIQNLSNISLPDFLLWIADNEVKEQN